MSAAVLIVTLPIMSIGDGVPALFPEEGVLVSDGAGNVSAVTEDNAGGNAVFSNAVAAVAVSGKAVAPTNTVEYAGKAADAKLTGIALTNRYTKSETDAMILGVHNDIGNHKTDTNNPHNVTAVQVGAVAEGDSIHVEGQTEDDYAMFGSSDLSLMGITLSHKSGGSISKFNIIPNTGGGPAAFSISLVDASSGVPYFPPEIFYLPAGVGGGRLALESWNSLSKSLVDAVTNRTADCESIKTNMCNLVHDGIVDTVNTTKSRFYDAGLGVEWTFVPYNGEYMFIATTNVNREVIE